MDEFMNVFLQLAEESVVAIEQACESEEVDIEGVLFQSELLVRDAVLVEGFIEPEIGERLLEEVVSVSRAVQNLADEKHRRHV